jgi:hypothetical protein
MRSRICCHVFPACDVSSSMGVDLGKERMSICVGSAIVKIGVGGGMRALKDS